MAIAITMSGPIENTEYRRVRHPAAHPCDPSGGWLSLAAASTIATWPQLFARCTLTPR
jgi:hypothetical protein